MRKLLAALVAVLFSASAFAAGLPLLPSTPQFSEASQIVGTINALIQQLNGQAGYAAATPIIGVGQFCSGTSATSTVVCNGQRGTVAFTGTAITVTTAASTQVLTITNSSVAANSICQAEFLTAFTASAAVVAAQIVPTAGSLALTIVSSGATNAVATGTLGFNCVN